MKITVEMDIDFALLRSQKLDLIDLTSVDKPSAEVAEGMLALLDHIQDYAVDSGQATEQEVFATSPICVTERVDTK